MNLRHLLVVLGLALAFSGCPKKKSEDASTEPVEGASSGNNEKSADSPNDEMQEKNGNRDADAPPTGGDAGGGAAPAPADPAPEEKK